MKKIMFYTFLLFNSSVFAMTSNEAIQYAERLISEAKDTKIYHSPNELSHSSFDLRLKDLTNSSSLLYPYTAQIELKIFLVKCDTTEIEECEKPKLENDMSYVLEIGIGSKRSTPLGLIATYDAENVSYTTTLSPEKTNRLFELYEKFER